ncbi:hypothetical protein N656DRAFT_718480 [Canariomyces notabilis]|uniref:F-box domain-containing protein n=1 Tax=Canariomyces notabilis TaxID=2074819 RepID=A0AAN6QDH0_9PEZI|nr:hypothetical protein N656DRAFT_718480 [Canariomyces arenarius]
MTFSCQSFKFNDEGKRLDPSRISTSNIITPAKPSKISRESARSSLGLLDKFPAEILLLTLNLLDFQSLSRLSRVSLKGKVVVENLATYQDVMRHAPATLAALGRTRLLQYHPATAISQALRTEKCMACTEFGHFLFLPTCERVCFQCLVMKELLRVTTIELANEAFRLTDRHLERIPIMHSVPGTYGVRWDDNTEAPRELKYRLVSIKQARQLAIEVHGSI